jgi:hypothetical protein
MLAACSTGVVPAGPQTYMISRSGVGLQSGSAVKAGLYREADEWCRTRGLVMMPVSTDMRDAVYGQHPASAEMTFRALPAGDAELKRPTIEKPDYTQRVQVR